MQAESSVGCLIGIRFRGFGRANSCVAFSVIRMLGSPPLIAAQKTVCGFCGRVQLGWFDRKVRTVLDLPAAGFRIFLELAVRRIACQACDSVKRGRLDFLADIPRFTKRFAFYVRRPRRQAPIRDVAGQLRLTWDTANTREMQYMRAQIAQAGTSAPRAIGIDEISVRRGHTCRIVVSDLVRKRPVWFGGAGRPEASMAQFYTWLGAKKCNKTGLVVMYMLKPFRDVAADYVP